MASEREDYLALVEHSRRFIDRVKEPDYAQMARLLGWTEDEVRAEHGRMFDEYLASLGLTKAEVIARMVAR